MSAAQDPVPLGLGTAVIARLALTLQEGLSPFVAETPLPAHLSAGGTNRNLFLWLPVPVDQSPFPLADTIKTGNGEWISSQCPLPGFLRERQGLALNVNSLFKKA